MEAVKNGAGDTLVKRAAEHGEPALQVNTTWQRMSYISPLRKGRKKVRKRVTPRRDSAFGTVGLHAVGVWKRILRLSTRNRRFFKKNVAKSRSAV